MGQRRLRNQPADHGGKGNATSKAGRKQRDFRAVCRDALKLVTDGLAKGRSLRTLINQVCRMSRKCKPRRPPNVNDRRRAIVMKVLEYAQDKHEAVEICRNHPVILELCRKHRRTPSDFIRYSLIERAYRDRANSRRDESPPQRPGVEDWRVAHVQR